MSLSTFGEAYRRIRVKNLSETLAPFLFETNLKIFGIGEILICRGAVAEDTSLMGCDTVSFGGAVTHLSKDFSAFTFMVQQ